MSEEGEGRLRATEAATASLRVHLPQAQQAVCMPPTTVVSTRAPQTQQEVFRPPSSVVDTRALPALRAAFWAPTFTKSYGKLSREQVLLRLRQNASFSGQVLSGLDLSGLVFYNAQLSNTNFEGANLHRAYLGGANLQHANFARDNLTGADLSGSNLQGATGLGSARLFTSARVSVSADLKGAKHTFRQLVAIPVDGTVVVIMGRLCRWGEEYHWDPKWWSRQEWSLCPEDGLSCTAAEEFGIFAP